MTLKRMRWLVLICISLVFLWAACNPQKGDTQEKTFTYYYYPQLNVYYSHSDKQFHFTLDGGQTWQHKKGTTELANTLDDKVTIESAQPEVWQENAEHRKKYKGVFSNYTIVPRGDVSDSTGKTAQTNVEKKETNAEDDTNKPEEKRKKGFKKVREKIRKLFKGDN